VAPPPLPDAAAEDRPTLLKRLDALYARVGLLAVGQLVPPPLARSQQTARTAAAELAQFHARLKEAERARQSVAAGVESLRLDAALSQARDECQQAETRCQVAYLVFGRECTTAGCSVPGAEREIREIRQLQTRLTG
jgi:hypothetical protein